MSDPKKTAKKPNSLISSPGGTLSTAHLKALKSKPTALKPNQRQSKFGK
jgi:hypothetical protein